MFKCEQCEKSFETKAGLGTHIYRRHTESGFKHSTKKKDHKTRKYKKKKRSYTRHIPVEKTETPYKAIFCPCCGQPFVVLPTK